MKKNFCCGPCTEEMATVHEWRHNRGRQKAAVTQLAFEFAGIARNVDKMGTEETGL